MGSSGASCSGDGDGSAGIGIGRRALHIAGEPESSGMENCLPASFWPFGCRPDDETFNQC